MISLKMIGLLRLTIVLIGLGVGLFLMPQRAAAQGTDYDIFDDECFDVTGETFCDVEGVSDITAFTDASEIDTFVATYINDFTILDFGYFAVVDGQLVDQSGQLFDFVEEFDDGSGEAIGFMDDPIVYSSHGYVLDDVYEVEGFHDLDDDFGDDFPVGETLIDAPIGAPTITGISPTYGYVGSLGTVTIQGADLVDPFFISTSASVSTGSGLTVTPESVSGDPFGTESVTIGYSATQCASTGPRFIILSTQFGSDRGDQSFTLGDPTPIITSVSPGAWQAGTSFTATINGIGFGTSPTLTILGLQPGDITFSVVSAGDNQITANITVSSSASSQTATIRVQSNGYCGSGFQPANGNSSTSVPYFLPVQPVLAPVPQIQLYGQNITSAQSMVVGQQIALRAVVTLPAGFSISTQQWLLPTGTGAAATVGGFSNSSGSAPCLLAANCPLPDNNVGKVLALPSSTGDTSSTCASTPSQSNPPPNTFYSCYTFYWVSSGSSSQLITYNYTMNNQEPNSASVTFNVSGPTGLNVSVDIGKATVEPITGNNVTPGGTPTLILFGVPLRSPNTGTAGIVFQASATPPTGNNGRYLWTQLVNNDLMYREGYYTRGQCTGGPNPSNPQLDKEYPYSATLNSSPNPLIPNDIATDNPTSRTAMDQRVAEFARSFTATMYLLWTPTANNTCQSLNGNACTIPVPLGSINPNAGWHFVGDTINALNTTGAVNGTTWIMQYNPQPARPQFQQNTNPSTAQNSGFPTWGAPSPYLGQQTCPR